MEGEYFDHQDAIDTARRVRVLEPRQKTAWELSIMRVARAQALMWHRAPIHERMRLLADVDEEMKGDSE